MMSLSPSPFTPHAMQLKASRASLNDAEARESGWKGHLIGVQPLRPCGR